jgi:LysR family transcriptional regulator, flagellar master operon regulator
MNVTAAKTFLEVVSAGNLKRAAERLHVTQSTVTTRLNALEASLGQKLLIRGRSGTGLTAAGFKFQRYAQMLVQTWELARHEVGLPRGFRGVFNIGCHRELWDGAGDWWCDHVRRTQPDIALSVWPGEDADLVRWLASGLVDAVLGFEIAGREHWSVRPLFEDALVQVATVRRGLMRWDPGYVYVDMGPDFRRQHAAAYPVEETAAVTFGQSTWALQHILRWGGSGYLPLRLVHAHLEDGRLCRVEGAPVFRRACYAVFESGLRERREWLEPSLHELTGHVGAGQGR